MYGKEIGFVVAIVGAGLLPAYGQDADGIAKANRNEIVRVTSALESGSGARAKLSDAAFLAQAKSAVSQGMKDPDSAQFRAVRIKRAGNIRYICGEINAKNSYGGYVGYSRFLSDGDQVTVMDGEDSTFVLELMLFGQVRSGAARSTPNPAISALCAR